MRVEMKSPDHLWEYIHREVFREGDVVEGKDNAGTLFLITGEFLVCLNDAGVLPRGQHSGLYRKVSVTVVER